MQTPPPARCRPEAYNLFVSQLSKLETLHGLLTAAIAISMHELDDVDPDAVVAELDELASRVRRRVRGMERDALLAHLHGVLFDEEGFTGNTDDYYNRGNSYVPVVLETRRGIPITLTLIYKYVGRRLGLTVHGINAPGHFLARVEMEGSWTLVDPFYGGRVLSHDEALKQIESMLGREVPVPPFPAADTREESQDPMFKAATHREWLARILRNLRGAFDQAGRDDDVAAMIELFRLL